MEQLTAQVRQPLSPAFGDRVANQPRVILSAAPAAEQSCSRNGNAVVAVAFDVALLCRGGAIRSKEEILACSLFAGALFPFAFRDRDRRLGRSVKEL